jgi:cytochrome c2
MTRRIGWLLVCALAAVGAAAAAAQAPFGPAQDPLAGSRLFGAKGCARCHAINGLGGTIGPDLGRTARSRSFYDLGAAMWNHLPGMVDEMRRLGIARPELAPADAADLIGFLYTTRYFDPPGDADNGRRLFASKRCVTCHQYGGAGGVVGPALDFFGQFASPMFIATAMWNHTPAMAEAMTARLVPRPAFSGAELRDLSAFIAPASAGPRAGPLFVLPGRAEEGRRLFRLKRCNVCHAVAGEGGRVGPDLLGRGRDSVTDFAAAMWNKAPAMQAEMRARGLAVPRLRPEEMADLVAYLYAAGYFSERGNAARGRQLAVEKGCTACHAPAGRGGRSTAPPFDRLGNLESPAAVVAAMWNHTTVALAGGAPARWPVLTATNLADIAALIRQARGKP